MFQLRSIAARLILAISLTVAAACGILGTFSIIQERSLMRLALDQQLKLQYDSVIAAIDYEGRAALAVSAVVATLPPVAEAVAKSDRDALTALLQGPMAALKLQGIPLISFHTPPATAFYRAHDPKTFGEDISARRTTVVESNKTGKPIVGVEAGRDSLSIFAMTPIMRDGKSLAVADIGVSFNKQFVDNVKQRFGVDLAVHRFDGKAFANIGSTFVEQSLATQEELKSAFEGSALRRDTTLGGVDIPSGSTVVLLFGSANRDSAQFDNPDTVDLTRRSPRRHLAFGHGIHYCVGAALARIEARAVLTTLLDRTRGFSVDPDDTPRWAESFLVRRHEYLPLTFTRR